MSRWPVLLLLAAAEMAAAAAPPAAFGDAAGAAAGTGTTTVRVRVLNVGSDAGSVRVAVCPRADFLKPHCPYVAHAPARRGPVVVDVPGVPPGVYAVQAYHDANDNHRIDTNFFGIPTEGIGFSRDAPFRFGPPRFEDAAYSIAGALVAIDITLKFEPR